MRGLLQRALGPTVESILRRFEQSVGLEEHAALCARIEAEPPVADEEPAPAGDDAAPAGFDLAEGWDEDGAAVAALAAAAARVHERLRRGDLDPAAGDRLLADVLPGLPPRLWFRQRGALFGTARLLRALLAVADASEARTRDYTRDVCDRLLRHLEVRRDGWLPFRPAGRPAGAWDELERLRFTHALLDACERFGDLRYLNAVLKANDWHHRSLRRAGGVDPQQLALARRLYLQSFRRQEAQMRRHFARELPGA